MVYKLFEYTEGKWKYNSIKWPKLIKDNNLIKDDTIHLLLLPPKCTINKNIDKDLTYKLVRNISSCKINELLNNVVNFQAN